MDTKKLIQELAERLVWIAPVGSQHIDLNWPHRRDSKVRGFMVCRRCVNNVDQGNTRVDYLTLDGGWKSPFAEDRSLFPNFDAALTAAAKEVGLE